MMTRDLTFGHSSRFTLLSHSSHQSLTVSRYPCERYAGQKDKNRLIPFLFYNSLLFVLLTLSLPGHLRGRDGEQEGEKTYLLHSQPFTGKDSFLLLVHTCISHREERIACHEFIWCILRFLAWYDGGTPSLTLWRVKLPLFFLFLSHHFWQRQTLLSLLVPPQKEERESGGESSSGSGNWFSFCIRNERGNGPSGLLAKFSTHGR